MARRAASLIAVISLLVLAACGEESRQEEVIGALEDAGYTVSKVQAVSVFEPKPETVLTVEGEGLPDDRVVGIEFYATEEETRKVQKQYEKIHAVTDVDGTVLYSALSGVPREDFLEVVQAAE